jgi:aurora kinase
MIGKKLGKGKFGEVFLVKHKIIGFICALKIISKKLIR